MRQQKNTKTRPVDKERKKIFYLGKKKGTS
jgi:hypothetical protein